MAVQEAEVEPARRALPPAGERPGSSTLQPLRRLPVGAEVVAGGVSFRAWAPEARALDVVLRGPGEHEPGEQESATFQSLERDADGYFAGVVNAARDGSLYRYRIDGGAWLPDPASRFQPSGPHGWSEVIDPSRFAWIDQNWRGVSLPGAVLYEMHVGTFTPEGTWAAAAGQLEELRDLGVTCIEMMPIADFPGRFGWGYDGVDLFAPTHLYGRPDDLRAFINRAHEVGLGVILDVVYNHLGPDGNYLTKFSQDYFSPRHDTDWGQGINFDGPNSGPVREFYEANAGYWIDEFHFDGLRLDATQDIHDDSAEHILARVSRRVRSAARGRGAILVGENEPQDTRLIRPLDQQGYGLDALWNDDFHHTAMVSLAGRNEAYYTDYLGRPQEFISTVKRGFLYQGQRYKWQKKRRGTSTKGIPPAAFVTFIQNHDQLANSGQGMRCDRLSSPGRYRAMTALLLLAPGTPMLFQGQEFAASNPFFFFADHREDLAQLVYEGRKNFMAQFRSVAVAEVMARLPDPADPATFMRCKLNFLERQTNVEAYTLHRDLLKLRREDAAFRAQQPGVIDGAVLGSEAFVLRYFTGQDDDERLLVVNFGIDLHLDPAPEPLLAPPAGTEWCILWSSEDPRYGGNGTAPLDTEENWRIPGQAAVVLAPARQSPESERDGEESDDCSANNNSKRGVS